MDRRILFVRDGVVLGWNSLTDFARGEKEQETNKSPTSTVVEDDTLVPIGL